MTKSADLPTLLAEVKHLAARYYELTTRPLGITGEIAEQEAARLLHLQLADVREAGYDATDTGPEGRPERLQIKGCCIHGRLKPGARVGRIDVTKPWDAALLVLLDPTLEVTAIYRAERAAIERALLAPGSKARNERGALAISKFKAIGRKVWPVNGAQA